MTISFPKRKTEVLYTFAIPALLMLPVLLPFNLQGAEALSRTKRIIAHTMASFKMDRCRPDRPLNTWQSRFKTARELGLDEMTFFMEPDHRGEIGNFINLSKEAAKVPGFTVSICIGLPRCKLERDWLGVVEKWCDAAKNNPGIAKVNGRPIIWTYHAGCIPIPQWKAFIAKLKTKGYNPYFVGDMFSFALNKSGKFLKEADQWNTIMDSLYMFSPHFRGKRFQKIIETAAKANKRDGQPHYTIGTVGGGYWRWAKDKMSRNQHYDGTDKYVKNWQFINNQRDKLDWVHICTWNDYLEHTMNEPTRNTCGIYGELLLALGSKFKGIRLERPATFWITAPAELRNGPGGHKEYVYEARAINLPAGKTVTFEITFRDDKDKVIRREKAVISADKPAFRLDWTPKDKEFGESKYITMNAEVDVDGKKLTGSLPVLIWPSNDPHILYKMPRSLKLLPVEKIPAAPVITISQDGTMEVTPLPESGNPDYRVDVLYNMYIKGSEGVNLGKAMTGKMQLPGYGCFDPYYFQRGFRQAATITRDGRVSWSKPVWVEKGLPEIRKDKPVFDLKKITSKGFKPVKINFQPKNVQAPAGYVADTGLEFGDRGNGYYYGWSRDVQPFTRKRRLHPNVIYDTLIPFRYNISSWNWSIVLPNGKYKLNLGMGDIAYRGNQKLLVNGTDKLVDPTPHTLGCDDYELEVEVKNNLLKLSIESGDSATINYIEIIPAGK